MSSNKTQMPTSTETGSPFVVNKKGKKQKKQSPLPMRHGVSASRVWLPKVGDCKNSTEKHGEWETILEFLLDRFPFISDDIFKQRMSRGQVVSQTGEAISPVSPYQPEIHVFYYREIPDEPKIPFRETVLFKDEHIIVVDKPHFIPVTPTGRFVRECLLSRLKHHYQNEDISPIHRLDRETAGVMLYSCNVKARGAYQSLFEKRLVNKTYEAIAPIAERDFPYTHRSHIVSSGNPFFIMREEKDGRVNAETLMNIIEAKGGLARYKLEPVTGRQHQLRVHMMSIGCPIINDPFYPELLPNKGEDYSSPLQLLAKSVGFVDPFTGEERFFESEILLQGM
ncbi:MAG: tRNA pseudouridine32 synthase/23S rRNA pseudouridine746 synthase [Pseudoalteromonas tetraodonis]|jgi:tRNA pseudouridine32 synthase/23S rRNA pseudouridine746 synthase